MARERPASKNREVIAAYGFDKLGLSLPSSPLESPDCRIEWVPYGSSELPTDTTGIIFPSGIFERVEYDHNFMGERHATVTADRQSLLGLEREVANLLRAGGWVAILARDIVDEFPSGNY